VNKLPKWTAYYLGAIIAITLWAGFSLPGWVAAIVIATTGLGTRSLERRRKNRENTPVHHALGTRSQGDTPSTCFDLELRVY